MYYSIGCDCHPSYLLQKLGLRTKAGPLDWLDTHSLHCLEYFHDLVQNEFRDFITDLTNTGRFSRPSSKHYPYSCFFHAPTIIEDRTVQETYLRRAKRFLDDYKNQSCVFVGNIKSNYVASDEAVMKLYGDCIKIINDKKFIENNHTLFIYIRCNENLDENQKHIDSLCTKLKELNNKQMMIMKYCLHFSKDGMWGNTDLYPNYFHELLSLQK